MPAEPAPETALLSKRAAAKRLGVAPKRLDELVARGLLRYVLLPGRTRRRFTPADLNAAVEACTRCRDPEKRSRSNGPTRRTAISTSSSRVIAFTALRARMTKPSPKRSP